VKSGELIPAAYGDHGLDLIGDVDLLLPRSDMNRARRVLSAAGFRQAYFEPAQGELVDRDLADIARIEAVHYEMAPFLKIEPLGQVSPEFAQMARERDRNPVRKHNDELFLVIELDIHHNLAADIEADGFFERSVPSCHGVGRTLSAADHLWCILTRHYAETALHGKRSLRPLAYAAPLISAEQMNWDIVGKVAAELELGATLYYYLATLDRLAPGHVPRELLHGLHPSRSSRARDWGWQLSGTLGLVDPFPVAALARERARAEA
jgi:hypothetical protein